MLCGADDIVSLNFMSVITQCSRCVIMVATSSRIYNIMALDLCSVMFAVNGCEYVFGGSSLKLSFRSNCVVDFVDTDNA